MSGDVFCEFGICNELDQYCCGDNKCCAKIPLFWYYCFGILGFLFLSLVIVGIYVIFFKRRCKMPNIANRPTHSHYFKLVNEPI